MALRNVLLLFKETQPKQLDDGLLGGGVDWQINWWLIDNYYLDDSYVEILGRLLIGRW